MIENIKGNIMSNKTYRCKCKNCGMTWSFTGFCKPRFCSDMCNASYQEKQNIR